MIPINTDWLQWAEYYPDIDEDGYDGIHDGGVKGIREDAPENAKAAYKEWEKAMISIGRGI